MVVQRTVPVRRCKQHRDIYIMHASTGLWFNIHYLKILFLERGCPVLLISRKGFCAYAWMRGFLLRSEQLVNRSTQYETEGYKAKSKIRQKAR